MQNEQDTSKDWMDLKFRIRDLSKKEKRTSKLLQELVDISQTPYELISILRSNIYNGNHKADILDKIEKSQESFERWNSAFVHFFSYHAYEKGYINSMDTEAIFDSIIVNKLKELAKTPYEKRQVAEHVAHIARIRSDEIRKQADADLLEARKLCPRRIQGKNTTDN